MRDGANIMKQLRESEDRMKWANKSESQKSAGDSKRKPQDETVSSGFQ